jgi:NAD(P) transhydrogenase
MFRERDVVHALRTKAAQNLTRHGIALIHGIASFEDAHTVRVRSDDHADRLLAGSVVLVATGSRPHRASEIPYDDRLVLDSDTILRMDRLPRSLAVMGAGVIGCEYASIFSALGIQVTLLGGRDRLLPFLDHEISDRLRLQLELLGVHIRFETGVERYEPFGDAVRLHLSTGELLEVDKALVAAGRLGNTDGLDLPAIGIMPDARGLLKVNEHYQTALSHVYAAGDVIGFPALASVSMEQARVAVCHAFDFKYKTRVSPVLPLAVYTIPEVAMSGETEESCQQKHLPYCVGRAFYGNNARGQIIGDLAGEVKLIFSQADHTLYGVHVIGESASELVHVGEACLQLGGTLDFFIQTVFNYPTLGEAYKYAAYDGLQNLARLQAGEPAATRRPPMADERSGA